MIFSIFWLIWDCNTLDNPESVVFRIDFHFESRAHTSTSQQEDEGFLHGAGLLCPAGPLCLVQFYPISVCNLICWFVTMSCGLAALRSWKSHLTISTGSCLGWTSGNCNVALACELVFQCMSSCNQWKHYKKIKTISKIMMTEILMQTKRRQFSLSPEIWKPK